MISLYSGEAAAGALFDIGVNIGSLLSELDRAMLQCKHQAIAPLSHHTQKTYSKDNSDRLDAEGERFVEDQVVPHTAHLGLKNVTMHFHTAKHRAFQRSGTIF